MKGLKKAAKQLEEQSTTKSKYLIRFVQLTVIVICFLFFWSLTLLFMETVTFFVEVAVYTMMGLIVNAGSSMQYITGECLFRLLVCFIA